MAYADLGSDRLTGAYVRDEPVASSSPPASEVGAVHWLRANLFSGPGNTVLTLVALALVVLIVPPVYRFLVGNAVWTGESREACLPGVVGHPVGACWAFILGRWQYYLFGQYPLDQRWRVVLSWGLGLVAIVWLLAPRLGAKGYGALYGFVALPLLTIWLLAGGLGLQPVSTDLWGGLMVTLVIAAVGIVVSLPLGVVLALGRRSRLPIVRFLSIVFIEAVRGVPLITVLFMANRMLPLFLPEGVRPDPLLRVLVGVALFSAAYMAEVVRGGLQAMPRGQYEGGMALGLNYPMLMGFIILPQALKLVIPGIVNSFIELFKDTSLVEIVGIFDLTGTVQASNADPTWATPTTNFTSFAFAAIVYFVFCFGMSRYSLFMERRLDTGYRR